MTHDMMDEYSCHHKIISDNTGGPQGSQSYLTAKVFIFRETYGSGRRTKIRGINTVFIPRQNSSFRGSNLFSFRVSEYLPPIS